MAPALSVSGEWTLEHVRAWANDVRLFTRFGFDYPFSKAVHKTEALGTAWFDNYHDTIVAQSLPQCLDYELSLRGRGHFLENIADYDKVELAFVSSRNHS